MSHFSETLRQLIAIEDIKQDDLAARSGVDRSLISRMLRGKVPSRDQLASLCATISTDQNKRVELALAHLRDEIQPCINHSGFDERHFKLELSDAVSPAPLPHWFETLPETIQNDLHILAVGCLDMQEMRTVVKSWVDVISRYEADKDRKIVKFSKQESERIVAESQADYPVSTEKNPPAPTDQILSDEKQRRAQATRASNTAS